MSDVEGTLGSFREVETGEAFTLQNDYLLKVELAATTVMARNGAMVAYQGDVKFEHQGGGMGRLMKKALTGESLRLMKASGTGEVFLAKRAERIHVMRLDNEAITANGSNVLAFEAGIDWDIKKVQGGKAGMLAGGLFNVHLQGSGLVALVTEGEPVMLDVSSAPTFADPQAAVCWSGGVSTQIKTDVQAKSLIGMGSGESIQVGFSGNGWVLVQPSEGPPPMQAQ